MSLIKLIEGDDEARQNKCAAEIGEVLKRYDCVMIPTLIIVSGKMIHRVDVVAKQRDNTKIRVPGIGPN